MSTFTGHCQRGHDRVDFTDPAAFEAHFEAEHGRRPRRPGQAGPATFGRAAPMRSPRPHPWRAPRGKAPSLAGWVDQGLLEVVA